MRFLHAIVAFFSVVLLFIQQHYLCAGPFTKKESVPAWPRSSGDSSQLLAADRVGWSRAARGNQERRRPRYKRDPEIAVDNEFIGYRPREADD